MLLVFFIGVLCFLIGIQISTEDLKLLSFRYNYHISYVQIVTYVCVLLVFVLFITECIHNGIVATLLSCTVSFFISIAAVWCISKVNSSNLAVTLLEIGCVIVIMEAISLISLGLSYVMPIVFGLYYRNNRYSAPFKKEFLLFSHVYHARHTLRQESVGSIGDTDYKYAGKGFFQSLTLPVYDIRDYGIKPNNEEDILFKLQALIEKVGKEGGGKIYFPKGKYLLNKDSIQRCFLRIDYSHIHLIGETDSAGKPLAKLINCNHTLSGEKNPWLSPFFITTGELIQPSNIFWGIQFLKKKSIVTKSNSMSDPGSDGTILTPPFLTNITEDSVKGSDIITVADTNCLQKVKYIMIAMYNTTEDGNLIKDILGVNKLRPEWKTALRAGAEQAPSYQWLAEIDKIIDGNTIRLTRPLLRDISVCYNPKVFSVNMLEDIQICNLLVSSKWNGIFLHHGSHKYYNVKQAQEMDYGWNAINMKRVAHGVISNVIIENFTNPLYMLDSRNIEVSDCIIRGADGHQGIKLYEHTCDCLIRDVVFYNHYADMLGGEGNAYGNVFDRISYSNNYFKPVDFDFHGFSEGPMSPPSHNLFINIYGFRNIKGAGAEYNQPACSQYNCWNNWERKGNLKGESLFYNIHYASGNNAMPRDNHRELFKNSIIISVKE